MIRAARVSGWGAIAACALAVAASRWFQGVSIVGDHGLFIDYFTQTETTWVFVFLSLTLCSRGKFAAGAALTGATFSINAFVGIWLLCINGVATLWAKQTPTMRSLLKAAIAFALLAAPAFVWILETINVGANATPFSFRAYIRQYDPQHFLIEAASARAVIQLGLLTAAGFAATWFMPNRRFWVGAQIGCVLLFLVGIPLPYWIDNRFVFNLHLMRSTGLEQAIAVVLIAIAATQLMVTRSEFRSRLLGVIALVAIATLDRGILGAGAICATLIAGISADQRAHIGSEKASTAWLSRFASPLFWLSIVLFIAALLQDVISEHVGVTQLFRWAVIAAAVAALGVRWLGATLKTYAVATVLAAYVCGEAAILIHWRASEDERAQASASVDHSWAELIDRIRSSDLHGVFLIPVAKKRRDIDFQLLARRQVWVDDKQGAAVMWAPWFATQWMPRHREVIALRTPEEFVAYAKRNSIPHIVVETQTGVCPAPAQKKMQSSHFIVCSLQK